MKKQNKTVSGLLSACLVLATGFSANAQILETMGTAGGGATQTIGARETNGQFDQVNLTYAGSADMRTTTPSTGYPGASGSYNTLIQAQETFEIQGINASACDAADSIYFGVFKSINASTGIDFLVLEYSNNNGASWNPITFPALPTGTGTSKWYKRGAALPAGALVPNLWVRFRSTLTGSSTANPQFRIDDVQLTCGSTSACGENSASVVVTGSTVYCAGSGSTTLTATTSIVSPAFQWSDQNGPIAGETSNVFSPAVSGTYFVSVSSALGCEAVSNGVYILVYPQPSYCAADVEGCVGDTVETCVQVQATDLIISEYVEGSGFNKYLELFNGTCADKDLSAYEVRAYHNGAPMTTPSYIIPLSGTLLSGNAFVIANIDATAWTGTPDLITEDFQVNGDDAVVLFNVRTGKAVDIFGSVGNDPGSAWTSANGRTTVNKTLVRKACVYSGITANPNLTGVNGFPTLPTEWDTLASDNVSGLGSHSMGAASYDFTLTTGDATILSETNNCVTVVLGRTASQITVNGTFCTFNDCGDINNVIGLTSVNCEARKAKIGANTAAASATAYPNPAADEVTLSFQAAEGTVTVTLTDVNGKSFTVVSDKVRAGAQQVTVDMSGFAPGVYICHIATASGEETLRLIKSGK